MRLGSPTYWQPRCDEMKVVLFCGGLGMRLKEHEDSVPKPLVKIGQRPIIWHVMKYYAHYGHKDFILALGNQANAIKSYFLNYSEYESNDFVLSNGGRDVTLLNSDIADWRITFVDTGLKSSVGERLMAVQHLLEDEDWFLANYTDGLTDLDLNEMIEFGQSAEPRRHLPRRQTQCQLSHGGHRRGRPGPCHPQRPSRGDADQRGLSSSCRTRSSNTCGKEKSSSWSPSGG